MRLVIAEKPSVANNIADVLGANDRKDGYREGNGYVVSWCFGHLVELKEPQEYDEAYSKWNYDSLPIIPQEFQYRAKDDTKKQFQILKDLMSDSRITEIVEATDAGREGELIFRLTYMLAHCQKPILRLWISSMEESAISDGFENLRPGEEYQDLYDSALARQQADWLVGINGTRLFTVLYKNKVLKVGRVQTPTLAMMAARELEIMNFQKKPYYTVELHVDGVKAVSARYEEKGQAEEIAAKCKNGDATVIEAIKEEKTIHPPKLYDLTSLQRDANKLFGFTAKQTLEHTQNLYEKKLVTYPRTDSQYLSDDMEQTASAVIGAIKNEIPFVKDMDEYVPELKKVLNSKKVTDHHAIIPTVEIKKEMDISDAERKVLFLIANRLLCATAQKHVYVSENVTIACAGVEFSITGKEIKDNGWKAYEEKLKEHFSLKKDASDEDEDELNPIRFTKGENVKVQEASVAEKFTKAPPRYTEATLLSAMEKAGSSEMDDEVERKGLGTPATRADIIEKLVKDGFVKREKKNMVPTEDGMNLINILPDVVKSPQLTADWENELVRVSKGESSRDEFLHGITKMVENLVKSYSSVSTNPFAKASESLGKCPKCGSGVAKGKFGAYCSNKCGMQFGKVMGEMLTDAEVKTLLAGKKILRKGLKSKSGKSYDAYFSPAGIKEFSYTGKDGNQVEGYQFDLEMSFPAKKKK